MTIRVNCPNPRCKHNKESFSVVMASPIAKKGGNARWKKMTAAEKKEHIARMTRARLKRPKPEKLKK